MKFWSSGEILVKLSNFGQVVSGEILVKWLNYGQVVKIWSSGENFGEVVKILVKW